MALPKLNDSPRYELTVPSTGKAIKFRPFLVKEEKVLMLAIETNDPALILNSVIDTIEACVQDDLNVQSLATFDIEYLFTQLRAKSVGETAKVNISCNSNDCKHATEYNIPLDTIVVDNVKTDNNEKTIKLNENISIETENPTFNKVMQVMKDVGEESSTEQAFGLIRSSLKTLITDEERIEFQHESVETINAFIESMNNTQFIKIQEWVEQMPKMTYKAEFECQSCGHKNEHTLEGMQNFF